MSIKKTYFWTYLRLLKDIFPESFRWNRYGIDLRDNLKKKEVDLTIRAHAIEKGMSLGHVRLGFGQPKAISLIKDIERYVTVGGDLKFVQNIVSILNSYIIFNQYTEENDVVVSLNNLCKKYGLYSKPIGGVQTYRFNDIEKQMHSEFCDFSQSRHAIRDFGSTPIDKEAIIRALKMCEKTPSACNRQSWHVYIVEDKKKRDKLMEMQGGVKGCDEDIQSAILVCGDIRNYGTSERSLPYIDGGLYAMNLMYALHYEGIANIPLSMSYEHKRVNKMKNLIGVPEYEVPVLLLAIGSYKDNFKVAASIRKNYKEYTSII